MVDIFLPIKFEKRNARDPFIGKAQMMQIDHHLRIRKMLHEQNFKI